MNPQDLLYTNQFVGTTDLEFDQNKLTKDRMNVLKTIDRPFPKRYNRNWDPIISNEVRDIVKDRYKKYKTTAICIDSRDRNCDIYPKPNDYLVILSAQFNYIESISLLDVDLGNIFLTKTQISWLLEPMEGGTFSINIPCGNYSARRLAEIMMNYMSMQVDNNGNIQNIFVNIDSMLNEIKIINRLQIPEIIAIQTILINSDDVFSTIPPGGYRQDGVYILVNHTFSNINFPLVITSMPNIGGFPKELFNCQEFFNGNSNGNEYIFSGSITINGTIYNRYLLIPRINEQELTTLTAQNIITSAAISRYLSTTMNNNFIGNFDNKLIECLPIIGEAREFTIDFENSPLMEVFGWYECDNEFRYILNNNTSLNISKQKCFNVYKDYCCEYMFTIEPYILLKLSVPSYAEDRIAGNIIKSQNLPRKILCDCDEAKDVVNIFAKISLNKENRFETSILKFYDTPLEKLNEIMVTFVDSDGCLIDLKCDQTITLEVVEAVDVLKDTLIDSRHGEVNITGIRE